MAQLPNAFASKDHQGGKALPEGVYTAQIVKSEMKNTKANDGSQYLVLMFQILGDQGKGATFFESLNLINKNETAVMIANQMLARICEAVGKPSITNSDELHGIPMQVTLKVVEAKSQFPEKNQATKFAPYQGEVTSAATPVPKGFGGGEAPWNQQTPGQ